MKMTWGSLGVAFAAIAVLGGCASGEEQAEPAAPVTVTTSETVTETATVAPSPEQSPESQVGGGDPGSGDQFPMPNEVGKILQAAQDDLQAASGNPFFYSDSEDATGAGRFQVLDSGWQVCGQNIRPGDPVSIDGEIVVFQVVRVEEQCP